MGAMMGAVLTDKVTPAKVNAACNAGSKLMRMVDLQMKYSKTPNAATKFLNSKRVA